MGGTVESNGCVTLPRAALLQFGNGEMSVKVCTKGRFEPELASLLAIRPSEPLKPLAGLKSVLRDYQTRGVEWLLFLYDNHFGGLLCDEMGLGKTHQALGVICAIAEQRSGKGPTLVVCPTTVIGHWTELLHRFAPAIPFIVYHGSERDIGVGDYGPRVIITSYGILRNDAGLLAGIPFALAVFDEAQNLKNRSTGSWEAAKRIPARTRLCLTGTPVENSLTDLKALFDIAMPGYLGADLRFIDSFIAPIETSFDQRAQARLRRLVGPFMMRRLKSDVLTELPEKIIDVRNCDLSEEQRSLYDALTRKEGTPIAARLGDNSAPIPIMHVFHLIEKYKQICDHPAVFLKRPQDHEAHSSGKFDLFAEILREALDSGGKVVVFSQHLDMIEIIRLHLLSLGTGHVMLTGRSRNRGALVNEFNSDPGTRVFLGSLKAGGTGIDLTAATIVIHYDRWWNAAREEQATDRVHRIGQTRGVLVIKFITAGTIEERINAIIMRKSALAEKSLVADSPDSLKIFTREELLEIVSGGRI
jgi:SNF2 family DNA or RNA helicase